MNPNRCLYWDCETSALPESKLLDIMPRFDAPSNLRDSDKIIAAVAAKRQDWLDSAALRATTGQIIAVGSAWDRQAPEFDAADERTLIEIVLHDCLECMAAGGLIFTWNGDGFDLPFLLQRAAVYGIPAFRQLTNHRNGRRYFDGSFVDAMRVWDCYSSQHRTSLDTAAKVLGVGAKTGSGADFAALLKSDPAKAKEYCLNDVDLLRKVVTKMGLNARE